MQSAPYAFDGVFDWSWLEGCFGDTKIMPMDIDGIIERKGHFLVFETKEKGKPIPQGQKILLRALYDTGCFTICILWGKECPEEAFFMFSKKFSRQGQFWIKNDTREQLREKVNIWYNLANS